MRFRSMILVFVALRLFGGEDRPLLSLPYTPSLDTQFMDRSADPCVDFYQYACGNWKKLNPMPADRDRWNVYIKMTDENERFLWGVLEQSADAKRSRTANEQKIGDFFASCMDISSVEREDSKPLRAMLAEIASLDSVTKIPTYVAKQHRDGIDRGVLFSFGSGLDFDDSSKQIAFARAAGLGLPDRDYYTKTDAKSVEIRSRYVEHVERMLEMLGESASDARADAQAVMGIETTLAQASLTRVEQRDPYKLKHRISREELVRMVPEFDWDVYLKALGAPDFETVNVTEPKFYQALNALLAKEKMATWRAYFRWQLVNAESPYLSPRFESADYDFFHRYLTGTPEMPPRWKKCTRLVDEELGEALGQVFVAKTFSEQTKQDAKRMTQQIEKQMEEDIRQLSWMSGPTKQQALTKLHAIVNKIGYPDKWRDYSTVIIAKQSFANNLRETSAFEAHRELGKIGKPVDRGEFDITPPTVDADYDAQLNAINFPAGVLQPPLFDSKLDDAPNFGNTGATMGHELTHGFDDEGRQFDAKGNLKDWWTPEDAKAFEERASCVRNQYAQYKVVDEIKINSALTLGEDVADLGGTLLAYLAWKEETAHKDLKGMDDLSPEQRFFVGMAQWACGDQRAESKRLHAMTDPHSPDEFRINGVVSNMPEFGQAFGCKAGQPMVRANACRVW